MSILAGIGSVLGGLGGLFGSRQKSPKVDIRKNMHDQARGAREAGAKYGFNPLTMLGASGAVAGVAQGSAGSPPPLASIAAITGGLEDIQQARSGDKEREDAFLEAQTDLLRIQAEQLRAGVAAPAVQAPIAANSVGNGPAAFGRQAVVASPVRGDPAAAAPKGTAFNAPNPLTPGRQKDVAPLVNSPGVFEMQSELTLGVPITIPGEGEPWGADELATGAVFGVPQVIGHGLEKAAQAIKDRYWDGKPLVPYLRDKAEERSKTPEAKKEREEWDRIHSGATVFNPYKR